MNKPKSITQLSKEQLEDLCLNLMHTDKVKTEMINQLETNWDELKGWLKANDIHYAEAIPFRETLNKMQELERGKE